ncbi:hydrogenase expression/formation protein HypC [Nocardia transvalensis]|uniref:Hydrogenase expression/formation protein HypC n=1 Tax=Nocardia transvalensis TaxID=37333 RepID=A0A7W9UKQ3_9NOCA|nr:HypC/HybG/HupF family hydrogenase formation chaperone [Nocardia transvalensis]MBB5916726.1 hydrogenase expression/formation protein HypC [Nocardia transvalensis]
MCLGVPGRIVASADDGVLRMGTVDFDGVRRTVCLAYVPDAEIDDYVIVHVGFAISRVDEAEAAETLAVLRAIPDALVTELGPDLPNRAEAP